MVSWSVTKEVCSKAIFQAVKWGAIGHCFWEYGLDIVSCEGPSMEPTIKSKDMILFEKTTLRFGSLGRNSVVVSKSASNPKDLICKRVVAIAGDEVILPDGSQASIPKGHIWLEGDNVQNSLDSRFYGPIPIGLIKGRVLVKIWPLDEAGYLAKPKS